MEIWFDGGVQPVAQGCPDLIPIMQKHSPKAIVFGSPAPGGIRWSGNEVGTVPYPCWSTIKDFGDNIGGDGDGKLWTPAECDSTLPGHDWFWGGGDPSAKPNEESQQKMLVELMGKYYQSVGHKRIQQFKRTEVVKIRFRATNAVAPPVIRRLAVFDVA